MKKTLLISLLLFICMGLLSAGPFGIEMGQSLEDLEKNGFKPTPFKDRAGYFDVFPKSTHPDFESYFVRIDENEGVFFIKAIGNDIDDSGYGFNTKSKFNEIRDMLDSTYGQSKLSDILLPGSIWDEPDDWMMGLRKKERVYIAHWERPNGSLFSGNIKEIYIAANALSSSTGYVGLEYYGAKHAELSEKAKKVASQVF